MPAALIVFVFGLGAVAWSVIVARLMASTPQRIVAWRSGNRWQRFWVGLYGRETESEIAGRIRAAERAGIAVGIVLAVLGLVLWTI